MSHQFFKNKDLKKKHSDKTCLKWMSATKKQSVTERVSQVSDIAQEIIGAVADPLAAKAVTTFLYCCDKRQVPVADPLAAKAVTTFALPLLSALSGAVADPLAAKAVTTTFKVGNRVFVVVADPLAAKAVTTA